MGLPQVFEFDEVWNPANGEIWVLQKVAGKGTYELAGRWRASRHVASAHTRIDDQPLESADQLWQVAGRVNIAAPAKLPVIDVGQHTVRSLKLAPQTAMMRALQIQDLDFNSLFFSSLQNVTNNLAVVNFKR